MIGVALISGLLMGATWQWVMPVVANRYEQLEARLNGNNESVKLVTLRAQDNPRKELFCREYVRAEQKMRGVVVFDRGSKDGDGVLVEAQEATWNPEAGNWELVAGSITTGAGLVKDIRKKEWLDMDGVTPRLLMELMADADRDKAKRAMDAMMTMKKIDIAALEAAAQAT